MNLLKETLECLKDNNKTPEDVLWVGSQDGKFAISWNEFIKLSENFEYDAGFGAQEVASNLVVVGDNWWLERSEYDGSESWEFKSIIKRSENSKKFKEIRMWGPIEELNEEE